MSDELPNGWVSARLEEIVTKKKGKKPDVLRDSPAEGFVPYLDIHAIEKNVVRQFAEAKSSKLASKDDLFVVWDGARSGWVGGGITGAIGSTIMALTAQQAESHYVRHFIASQFQTLNNNTRGTGIPHVDPEVFWNLEVPLAPLGEQRRIVAKLTELLGKVDASQQRLAKIPVLLKRFRQSVLAAACSGRLTADWREQHDQDDEWPVHKLSVLGRVMGGITKNAKRQSINLQVPYLRVANVYQDRLELDEVLRIGVTQQELERTRLAKGDLLFVEGNGSLDQIGRLAMWDGSIPECVHQNHLIKFRAGNLVEPRYVLLQMMSQDGRSQLVEKAISSAGLHSLSISKISDVNLPVAPLPEQQEIVRRVEGLFALADQLEGRLAKARGQVEKLTPSLLARAFAGQLVPQNPTDEPAEKLLERIKTNQTKPGEKKKSCQRKLKQELP